MTYTSKDDSDACVTNLKRYNMRVLHSDDQDVHYVETYNHYCRVGFNQWEEFVNNEWVPCGQYISRSLEKSLEELLEDSRVS